MPGRLLESRPGLGEERGQMTMEVQLAEENVMLRRVDGDTNI
jgi:hypothetical protein